MANRLAELMSRGRPVRQNAMRALMAEQMTHRPQAQYQNPLAQAEQYLYDKSSIYHGLKDGFTAPAQAYRGELSPKMYMNEDGTVSVEGSAEERAMGTAGSAMTGGFASTAVNPLSAGSLAAGGYIKSTPLKPDPRVGARFEKEYVGGLVDKIPLKIEDLHGSSVIVNPWDNMSANMRIKSFSDNPVDLITQGGQPYARVQANVDDGVGGASNLAIAKRVQERVNVAQQENLAAGGNGDVYMMPITMAEGAEGFSSAPTNLLFQLADQAKLKKKEIGLIDSMVRNYPITKNVNGVNTVTYPLKGFEGIMTEQGRAQIYTGEGLGTTAGELRKAITNRLTLKGMQDRLGYNLEDMRGAILDEDLIGLPRGYGGNTIIKAQPNGLLMRSNHTDYDTGNAGRYSGTLGRSTPVETLFPDVFEQIGKETNKGGKLYGRDHILGAMEKRKGGVSQLIDDKMIENYYKYLKNARAKGLLE